MSSDEREAADSLLNIDDEDGEGDGLDNSEHTEENTDNSESTEKNANEGESTEETKIDEKKIVKYVRVDRGNSDQCLHFG
jgi:hypothetical protein